MMNLKLIKVAAFAAVFIATSAQGATITNNETTSQKIKIIAGDTEKTFTVAPSNTISVEEICSGNCVLALESGTEFEFASGEELMLEDGGVYVDPPAQGSGGAEQPAKQ